MPGRTKAEVRAKLQALHRELEAGLRVSATYSVASCVRDWLADGLTTRQASTVENYRRLADHAIGKLGAVKLKNLTARQVQQALAELSESLSTQSLRLVHQILERAIRHAQASDLVGCNVASLVTAPAGTPGRPSQALTFDQAAALLDAAAGHPLSAYLTLSLLSGLRTQELRSLPWSDIDFEAGTLAVYRSVRAGGETKTPTSRRVLKLPSRAVDSLRDNRTRQAAARLKAGPLWEDPGLVMSLRGPDVKRQAGARLHTLSAGPQGQAFPLACARAAHHPHGARLVRSRPDALAAGSACLVCLTAPAAAGPSGTGRR